MCEASNSSATEILYDSKKECFSIFLRKGLSAAEIAIFLVIAGIISVTGLKVKNILDNSRIRADISKIQNVINLYPLYVKQYGELPDLNGNYGNRRDKILSAGLFYDRMGIEKEDMKRLYFFRGRADFPSQTGGTSAAEYAVHFQRCSRTECIDRDYDFTCSSNVSKNVCTVVTNDHPKPLPDSYFNISPFALCMLEEVLDDRNLYTGSGMLYSNNPHAVHHVSNVQIRCRTESKKQKPKLRPEECRQWSYLFD